MHVTEGADKCPCYMNMYKYLTFFFFYIVLVYIRPW